MEYIPYQKTFWTDEIVDPITGEVIEKGTRYTAWRANNFEEGIFHLSLWIPFLNAHIARIESELEMVGRAPINNGSFLDTMDGSGSERGMVAFEEKATAQTALTAGTTTITLDSSPFLTGTTITIFDDTNQEHVEIVAQSGLTITVTALTKSYKKGANIARSNAHVVGKKLTIGTWGTYSVTTTEVV